MSTKKAYLMTLQEYLTEVVPVLKAYKDFLKKNKYFKQVSYGSLPEYSYPELVEAMKNKLRIGSMHLDFSEPELSYETHQQKLDRFWGSSTYNEAHLEKDPSADIINKKNEFVSKLKEYFGDDFFEHRMGEPDNTKTNKRAIKYAIEENIYKKLIEYGDYTISELSAIAESAGVKLPQNLVKLDTSYVLNNLYDAIYKSMPTINKDVLTKLVEEIKESFKPLEKQIYDKEVARFTILIENYAYSTDKKDIGVLFRSIPFVSKVLDYKTHTEYVGEGMKRRGISYAVNFQLLSGWQEQMQKFVKAFVDGLKAELVHSILDSFEKITQPITGYDVEYLGMARTGTDFNGIIQFNFANGSHFTLNSRAISAGGYNIQCYHFRYISDYMDVTLADGSKVKNPSLPQIIEHFSDKQASQELFNPFLAVQRAENLDQIIEPLYTFAKTKGALSNVRMNKGKEDVSLSFKTDPWNNANKNRMFKHGIYLKRDSPIDKNKEKAVLFLTENGAPQPTQFKSGGMTTDPREKAIAEYAKAHGVTKEFAATKVGDRKKIELPKELATGGDIIGDSAGIVLKKDGSWESIDQLEQNAMDLVKKAEYSSGDWRTDFEMHPGYKKGGSVPAHADFYYFDGDEIGEPFYYAAIPCTNEELVFITYQKNVEELDKPPYQFTSETFPFSAVREMMDFDDLHSVAQGALQVSLQYGGEDFSIKYFDTEEEAKKRAENFVHNLRLMRVKFEDETTVRTRVADAPITKKAKLENGGSASGEIGGNYHFRNDHGSFTWVTVMPVDENLKPSKYFFTVLSEVRRKAEGKKGEDGVVAIQKHHKTLPIAQYSDFIQDLINRGATKITEKVKLENGGSASGDRVEPSKQGQICKIINPRTFENPAESYIFVDEIPQSGGESLIQVVSITDLQRNIMNPERSPRKVIRKSNLYVVAEDLESYVGSWNSPSLEKGGSVSTITPTSVAEQSNSFVVVLSSVGNPDRKQYTKSVSIPEFVPFGTLGEASEICRNYISEWDLGGGNWSDESGAVYHPVKGLIAHVSYNGRIWDNEGKEITGQGLRATV